MRGKIDLAKHMTFLAIVLGIGAVWLFVIKTIDREHH